VIDGDIETGIYTTGFTKKNGKIPDGPPIGKGFDGLERFLKRETHERR